MAKRSVYTPRGDAVIGDDTSKQLEVSDCILSFPEHPVWSRPCSVVHRQEQGEPGSTVLQSFLGRMVAAVELKEHSFLG